MRMLIKNFFIQKFAELLNHLYFHNAQNQGNFLIIVLFFIQKSSILLLSNQQNESQTKDIYFYICEQFLQWGTIQKPLQIIASNNLNLTITLIFEVFQFIILTIFCFSLYQKQIISTYFSFYLSNFQLIILYQVEIQILVQCYNKLFSILLIIPLYINYFIILYCSRNYLLLQKQNMIKKFSYFNFIIMTYDFFVFILYDIITEYERNYILLILFLIYFFDALYFKPYYSKMNDQYLYITFILVIIAVIKILMWDSLFQDQIYILLIFSPLLSVLMKKIRDYPKNLFKQNLTLDFILDFGDHITNDFTVDTVQGKIGQLQIQKFCQFEKINNNTILKLLETYQLQLLEKKEYLSQKFLINQQREELQLYIIFLYQRVQGTYLQSLLKAKQFQIENENHSMFFSVISRLISEKYDQQVKYQSQNSQNQALEDYHKQLIEVRKVQIFYTNCIEKVTQVLDYKIYIWSQILSGFDYIEELLQLIIRLNLEIRTLESLNQKIKCKQDNNTSYSTLKNMNILSLRYFSFYNSYIMNDYQGTLQIELYLENILIKEKNKLANEILVTKIINTELMILSASILQCKGLIFNGNIEELSYFFGIDALQIKYYQNINQLMPKFINQNHNFFIDNFISKGISDLNNQTKIVFCQDGQGFIFPIELSLIHINEQSQDFILTAILSKIQSPTEYILFDERGKILGITKEIFKIITGQGSQQTNLKFQLDQSIFDCYIQFWIPNIFLLVDQSKHSVNTKNEKKIIEIAILRESKKLIEKLKQDLNHQSISNFDQFLFTTDEYSTQSFQISPNAQISIEVTIEQNKLPNNFSFYSLQIYNLQNNINKSTIFDGIQQEKYQSFNKINQVNQIYKNQTLLFRTEVEPIEDLLQTKRQTESFQKSLLKESLEKNQEEKLMQSQLSQTHQNYDNFKDLEIIKKENIYQQNNSNLKQQINGQKYTDSQSREIIKEILEKNNHNKHLKLIFYLQIILQIIIFTLSCLILNYFFSRNSNLSTKLQLMRLPDKFNRIYCSFTMMGQVDLERILEQQDKGEYFNYRVRTQSNSLRLEINEMMANLKNQLSKLEEENSLSLMNTRIISQHSYEEEVMTMFEFNLLAEFYVQDLNQFIKENHQVYNNQTEKFKNQYYKLQFLKANLINQISSSQKLIDQIINEIEQLNQEMEDKVEMLFIMQFLILSLIMMIQTYIWKQPYMLMKNFLQLITFPSNEILCQYIQNARHGKQMITKQSWKQINYYQEYFGRSENQYQSNYGHNKHMNQIKAQNMKEQQRLKKHHFKFFNVFLKNVLFLSITASFIVSGYIYLNYVLNSSHPEILLTLKFVQFKQDLDSIMILSFLLKTNIALTEKALELGFLDQNPYLLNQTLYFNLIYTEILENFSNKVPEAKSLNDEVFIALINQNRMKETDKETILNLYTKDLCYVLQNQLPFCAFSNNVFTYFPDYPVPTVQDNNREIFKVGISGIFLKILEIFQSDYHSELLNQKNLDATQKTLFIQTTNFKLFVLEYFFDINRAIITFYTTILASIVNILKQDFNYTLYFHLIIWAVTFIIQILLLFYSLQKFEFEIKASRYVFTLLPQECLRKTKCLSIIKLIYKKYIS